MKLIQGNISVVADNVVCHFSMTYAKERKGAIQNILDFKNITCRNTFAKLILKVFNISYNKKTCIVPKGKYVFTEIDIMKLSEGFNLVLGRGYGIYRCEFKVNGRTKDSMALCFLAKFQVSAEH
ncbi:hypothetical protein EVAR_47334_1 [Eumeta japonica]|uniref:Uncharacterized protein n=1 Tax=Eumeta variegata TaxID=151549 RepID=A0A4C1WWM0_EUMVA|nr:hypothetical protein EVAR_47334_1 [Eumeta japonica]